MPLNFARSIRAKTRTYLSVRPALYLPLVKIRHWFTRERIVNADTDIVIEGFPRSANTFAVFAFRFAQPQPVKIAHHLHAAVQVLGAIHYGIPAIVLIRHPKDAITSLTLRNPETSISTAFDDYFVFYRALLGKSGFVVAKFEDVVSDFGAVISRVNERFGTSFVPFSSTSEDTQNIFEAIETRHTKLTNSRSVNELMVARPSEAKKQAKGQIQKILGTTYANALREAEDLWREFCRQN